MRLRTKLGLWSALLLLAAACGPGAQPPAEDGTAPADGEAVEVMAVWTGAEQEGFTAALNAFTEQTGIQANYQPATGGDIGAVLGTRIEGGDPPDVGMLPNPGLLRDLAARGVLQPIEESAGDEVDANFSQAWRELGSVEGTLYGVFFKAANKSTVWYNVPLFEEVGIEPPADWESWVTTCQDVVAAGTACVGVGGADAWTLTDWFENVYVRTAGADMYDQLAAHEIPWTDESVRTAFETMGEIIGQPDFVAQGLDGALQTAFPDSVNLVFTDPPEAAMTYEGDFVAGVITAETGAEAGTDFDFFDFPAIEGSPPAVIGGGDVAVVLTDNPSAQALVEFLATPEAAQVWAELGGFSSPNMNVDPSVYPDDITRRSATAIAEAEIFKFDLSDLQPAQFGGTAGAGLFGGLQAWMENPDNVDQVLEQLEQEASAAFGG